MTNGLHHVTDRLVTFIAWEAVREEAEQQTDDIFSLIDYDFWSLPSIHDGFKTPNFSSKKAVEPNGQMKTNFYTFKPVIKLSRGSSPPTVLNDNVVYFSSES